MWIEGGRLRSRESRHDFHEWVQTLDWIVQKILDEAPLMDGHQAAQERVSNPDLTFHRNLALAVADRDAHNKSLIASELYEISYCAGVDIPGLRVTDEGKGRLAIGTIMRRLFEDSMVVTVEGSNVNR